MLAAGGGRSVGARGLGASGPARPHHHYLERWLVRVVAVIVRASFGYVSAWVEGWAVAGPSGPGLGASGPARPHHHYLEL